MNSPGRILLALALAAVVLRAAAPEVAVRVHGRSERASGAAPHEEQAFRSFVSAFRTEMARRSARAGEGGWEFWVVLRGDPKNSGKPHVLVVGRAGKLMVRVADIPSAVLNIAQDCVRTADRSLELMRSPAPRVAAAVAR
jgi:hypothetical protein